MKTFALVLIILGIVAVVCFAVAFFIELAKTNENKELVAEDYYNSTENQVAVDETGDEQKEEDFDLDAMLAKLEASAIENVKEAESVEETETVSEDDENQVANEVEEVKSETGEVEEVKNEEENETSETGEVAQTVETELTEENHEVSKTGENAEVSEEQPVEEVENSETVEEVPAEEETQQVIVDDEPTDTEFEVSDADSNKGKVIVVREHTVEVINNGAEKVEETQPSQEVVDLSTRLASVRESLEKVEADLVKANRDVNRYERTERRKARNQKLLDKKAEDLTKLNLVLYSVTDIKNIDTDKKNKQQELVTHINELKSSIKDAEIYLDTNKEKYDNAQKMKTFFEGEKARLEADEKEILTLMGQNTDND